MSVKISDEFQYTQSMVHSPTDAIWMRDSSSVAGIEA